MKLETISRKTVLIGLLIILLCFAGGTIAWAAIPQSMIRCMGCHTNHEGGHPLLPQYEGPEGCVNCHSSDTFSTTYDLDLGGGMGQTVTVPVVYYTGEDPPTEYLAGGNFYWVAISDEDDPEHPNDNKGHNVCSSNPENVLVNGAPGISHGAGCSWAASCHFNFDLTNDLGMPGLQGRQGCTKCHMLTDDMDYDDPKGFHHADDTVAPVVGGDLQDPIDDEDFDGFFRFLHGHQSGDNHGVCGIEDADWQASSGPGDHNEYLGYQTSLASAGGFSVTGHTVTSFCCGCHGNFHIQECLPAQQPPCYGDWIRHVSGAILPDSGEFASYTTFDPDAPVARPDFTDWTGPSSTVTPGTDLVNCLSCHRAHGSPYPKMLRWDLSGCKTCHTNK